MPYSAKQKIVANIALHNPSKLNPANQGMLSMSKDQLQDFATGPIKKAISKKMKKGSYAS